MLDEMIDQDLDEQERKEVAEELENVRGILDWMGSYVRTADRSFEDALDALLAGKLPPPPTEPKPIRRRKPTPVQPPVTASSEDPGAESPAKHRRGDNGGVHRPIRRRRDAS
jgi:hypothetical protein